MHYTHACTHTPCIHTHTHKHTHTHAHTHMHTHTCTHTHTHYSNSDRLGDSGNFTVSSLAMTLSSSGEHGPMKSPTWNRTSPLSVPLTPSLGAWQLSSSILALAIASGIFFVTDSQRGMNLEIVIGQIQ